MPTYFRIQGTVQNPIGQAIPGASVAVLTQPASFATQPGSPLASIFAADTSNAATITGASWSGQQITFVFSTTPPADVVAGSYIGVSGVSPSGYNSMVLAPWLVVEVNGNNVIVAALTNPGTYISGGTVATSVLPNPTSTDGNGQWFAYMLPGIYSVQIYGPTITEQDFLDQGVGTVAGGSVLSVGMTGDGVIFNGTVGGSPVTTTGTLVPALLTQVAKTFLAGPTSGGNATPTFRTIAAGDLPAGSGSVSSVALTLAVPAILTQSVTGTPITTSGTLGLTIGLATQSANIVWAGPSSGGAGLPTFRALVGADLPFPSVSTLGGIEAIVGVTHQWISSIDTSGVPHLTQPAASDLSNGVTGSGAVVLVASPTLSGTITGGIFKGGIQDVVQTASGSSDAVTFPGATFVTTAGVDSMTLATPTAGTDDGKRVRVTDVGGHAHTITTAANKIAPSHSVLTFAGTIGNFVELQAFNGLWYVGASAGVTPS